MNQGIAWLVVALLVGLLAVRLFLVQKKSKKKFDYYMLYKLGMVFLLLGIYELLRYGGTTFIFLGGLYAAVGYFKRDERGK